MKPTVSIIIPAYNIGELIKETIDSALQQTYADFELIVVDDGSTDRTAEVVKAVKDERIVYHYQPNSGLPAKPRMKGVELSRGEYLAFLDHDDLWLPHKLEKQMAVMEGDTKLALVSTNAYFLYDGARSTVPLIHGLADGYFSAANLFPDNKVVQSTVLMEKAAYLAVGGLRAATDLKAVEDYDLWIRTYIKYPCYFINECLVYYRQRLNSTSGGDLLRLEREINHFKKYFAGYGLPKKITGEKIASLKRKRVLVRLRAWRAKVLKWLNIK
jgi:glycosyltransferase involved in cell wall biosynthesis